ncbi:MAG: protein kinase [Verrucomicrobia bacterium]|nr:protein kinase [Verrucomicrobiota bacterium]
MNDDKLHDAGSAREIFLQALEKPGTLREAFLDGACRGDAALRARVEALLRNHQADSFLEQPAAELPKTVLAPEPASLEEPGTLIGRYKLLEKIGEGGFGAVYVAEQREPVKRRVALKIIKLGMDTRQVVARFEAERQALALMDHPNIAKVLDAGATDAGRPYFVMELVRGVAITQYCDENHLSTIERLGLFIKVCHAIQHAHQKGIIHRDIKPSNILVTVNDGAPVPKVIDFGIAKATQGELTDKTIYTQFQQFIGTPAYMSPEQADMTSLDIDTRSDIYALGVLLYELLVGRTPFDGKELLMSGLDEMRRTIREQEPVRPSTRLDSLLGDERTTTAKRRSADPAKLAALLRGDVDWIVMKCLEKDRTRRYETANGLAADLKRYLNNEPVTARPPSVAYRFQKAFRRNKLAFAAAVAIFAALAVGLSFSTWSFYRERHARAEAERARASAVEEKHKATAAEANAVEQQHVAQKEQRKAEQSELETRRNLYAADMQAAYRAFYEGNLAHTHELLEPYWPTNRDGSRANEAHSPKSEIGRTSLTSAPTAATDIRDWEWRYLWHATKPDDATILGEFGGLGGMSGAVAFLPDGRQLAAIDELGHVKVWEVLSQREVFSTNLWSGTCELLADSPRDGLFAFVMPGGTEIKIWDVVMRRFLAQIPLEDKITGLAITPDGRTLASVAKNQLIVWNLTTGKETRRVTPLPPEKAGLLQFGYLSFSPDGRTLGLGLENGELLLWDFVNGSQIFLFQAHAEMALIKGAFTDVRFSADGKRVATAGVDHSIRLWEISTQQRIASFTNQMEPAWSTQFSPDGQTLASAGGDGTIRTWDVASEQELSRLYNHPGLPVALRYSPDGRKLASIDSLGRVKLWSTTPKTRDVVRKKLPPATNGLWFWPDQKLCGVWNTNGFTSLLDPDTLQEIHRVPKDDTVGFGNYWVASRGKLPAYTKRNQIQLRAFPLGSTESSEDIAELELQRDYPLYRLRLSLDGRFLAASDPTKAVLYDVTSHRELKRIEKRGYERVAEFSPDSRWVVVASSDGCLAWNTDTTEARQFARPAQGGWPYLAFAPDNKRFATSWSGGTVQLWSLDESQPLATFSPGLSAMFCVAFSSAGTRLAGGSQSGTIVLWDLDTKREVARLKDLNYKLSDVMFLDENTLAAVSPYEICVWRAPTMAEIEREEPARMSYLRKEEAK